MTDDFKVHAASTADGTPAGTAVRLAAALAMLISGLVHLQLYFDGYRNFPDANLGRSFVLNAVASTAFAIALVFRRELLVRAGAAVVLAGTLIALALSRTDRGVFGLSESGLNPSPQAGLTLVVAVIGLLLLAATLLPAIGPGQSMALAPAAVVAGLVVVVAVAGAVLWAREDERNAAASSTTAAAATAPTTTSGSTMAARGSTTTDPAATSTAQGPVTTGPPAAAATTPEAAPAAAPTTSAAPSGVMTVSIADFAFDAQTLEIPVGTTVEWVNNDSFAHSVVANDGSFRSEDLDTGDRFTFTFTTAGTFDYVCGIHPSMLGTVVVTG